MKGIAILLAAAAVGFGLSRWSSLPAIPILIAVGFIVGATGIVPDADTIEDALVLGLTFLVFVAGVELNPRRVGTLGVAALLVGFVQFVVLALAAVGAALLLNYPMTTAMYLGLAVAASSTLVVVRLLQQRRQMFEPFARLVIGVLLLQDLLIIVLIPVIAGIGLSPGAVALGLFKALLLVGIAFGVQRWVTPIVLVRWKLDEEGTLLTVLAILFGFIGLGYLLDLPLIAGGFLAGVSLSRFPVNGLIRGQLTPISDFFTAIFFTALGAFVVLPNPADLLHVLIFAGMVIVLTPILVAWIAERAGLSWRQSIESGLLLAQTSEFSIIVGLQGLAIGAISPEVLTIIALVTVITMIITPFVSSDRITWQFVHWRPTRKQEKPRARKKDHIVMLGCGDNAIPLLETLLLSGHEVLVVDDDPSVIHRLRENDVPSIRGDGSDIAILKSADVDDAKIVISLMRRSQDSETVLSHVQDVPVVVRVFDDHEAAFVRKRGGIPIVYSAATADAFMQWYEREFRQDVRPRDVARGHA